MVLGKAGSIFMWKDLQIIFIYKRYYEKIDIKIELAQPL